MPCHSPPPRPSKAASVLAREPLDLSCPALATAREACLWGKGLGGGASESRT